MFCCCCFFFFQTQKRQILIFGGISLITWTGVFFLICIRHPFLCFLTKAAVASQRTGDTLECSSKGLFQLLYSCLDYFCFVSSFVHFVCSLRTRLLVNEQVFFFFRCQSVQEFSILFFLASVELVLVIGGFGVSNNSITTSKHDEHFPPWQ